MKRNVNIDLATLKWFQVRMPMVNGYMWYGIGLMTIHKLLNVDH